MKNEKGSVLYGFQGDQDVASSEGGGDKGQTKAV